MKKILTICVLILAIATLCAQEKMNTRNPVKSLNDLSFMTGNWKGEGWIMTSSNERKEFVQEESIEFRLNGSILVIDGIGHGKKGTDIEDKIIHEAFGVISFNTELESISILSYTASKGKMENKMVLIADKKLEWSFKDERGGTVRFQENFSKDGQWFAKGEYSFDGKNWFQFMEMKLKRISNEQ